jgi:hypothetical protein
MKTSLARLSRRKRKFPKVSSEADVANESVQLA